MYSYFNGKQGCRGLLERRGKEKDSRKKLILKSARTLFLKKVLIKLQLMK